MKQYIKTSLAIYIAGLLITFSQSGCKEHTVISSSFAPGIGNINMSTQVFPVIAQTQYYDSVTTSTAETNIYMGLGVLQDPLVGKTNAGIYFQVIPGIKNTIYSNYVIDSAFIILPYSGFTYGDNSSLTAAQDYAVYPITDNTFSLTSSNLPNYYYPSSSLQTGSLYFTASANIYNLIDSFNVGGTNYHPHARLRIPNGNKILTDLMHADSMTSDYPSYTTYYPGIYIEATDTSSRNKSVALPYFQLDGSGSDNYSDANVLMYTHIPGLSSVLGGDSIVQLTFYFSTQYCAHYNKITRVYNNTGLAYFNSAPGPNQQVLLQNGPGAVIDIKIPGIRSLLQVDPVKHDTIVPIINQAQLIFTVSQSVTPYAPPNATYPYRDSTVAGYDILSEVADRYPVTSTSPLAFIDGNKDSTTNTLSGQKNYVYHINVPRELQQALVERLDTLHLRINGSTDYFGAFRAIIAGGSYSDTTLRMKFNVVYSRLK